MFLGWYDDSAKKSATQKIEEAVERYIVKFGHEPDLCLVNAVDLTACKGLQVRAVEYVRPNHFWVGEEESAIGPARAA